MGENILLNKTVMALAISFVFLMAVSLVSAEENVSADFAGMDNATCNLAGVSDYDELTQADDDLASDSNEDILKTNTKTFSDLYAEINSGDSEVYLSGNYTYNNASDSYYKNGIYIKQAMTIHGNGAVIDAKSSARIFMVYDNIGDVVIRDVVFVNGRHTYEGGAVKGNATVIGCTFVNNHAKEGGATYYSNAINCTFTNNSAGWAGAMYFGSAQNCTFTDNHADTAGAYAYGNAVGCIFTGNRADDKGGAMYGPKCSAVNCSFTNNRAINGAAMYGAACYAGNCTFTANCAEDWAGAMYSGTAVDCTFISNRANEGGAIYSDGKTAINCIFKNNTAVNGGAAYNLNATCCQFIDNSAGENGGAMFRGIALNSTFTHNRAEKEGGAGYELLASDSLFEFNHAANGGAMSATKAVNSTFSNNTAYVGGAVCNAKVSTDSRFADNSPNDTFNVTFFDRKAINTFTELNELINGNDNETIYLNTSYFYDFLTDSRFIEGIIINRNLTVYGNGFTLDGENTMRIFKVTGGNVVFRDIVFANGYAAGDGGAVLGKSTSINCTFKNNQANYGGAIYFGDAVNCTFIGNKAIYGSGGAMSSGNAQNCTFISNQANDDSGGAMHGGFAVNCRFIENTARYGGAVNELDDYALNCTFIANRASEWGGAAYGDFKVMNCTFTNNSALDGGAIYGAFASDSIFINNTAEEKGGAIFSSLNASLDNVFENNHAYYGGAIYFDSPLENVRFNSIFHNNSAYIGGAIYFNEFIANNVFMGNFTGNNATRTGGAIYVKGNSSGNRFMADFAYNRVENLSGGAMTFSGFACNNTFDSIFEYNRAWYGGAVFFADDADCNHFNGIFSNNYAGSCGGALFFQNLTNGNVFNSMFIANTAKIKNGGAATFKHTSRNCVFNGNFISNTGVYGGSINYMLVPYNITFNCDFISNSATSGGAIHFYENASNICYGGDFIGNSAVYGGAICSEEGCEIENVTFIDNMAEYGGAIYITQLGSVKNLKFTGNAAKFEGGAIYMVNKTNVTNCIFDSNSAPMGAAIFIKSKFTAPGNDSSFNPDEDISDENNTDWNETDWNETDWDESDDNESYNPNDDFMPKPEIFIIDSVFKNMHNNILGVIYCDYQNSLCINSSVFENLSGEYGPALYCTVYVDLFLYNSNFTNLAASRTAGAIALVDTVSATIDNCSFINASSSKNAGAIYIDENGWRTYSPTGVILTNSRFINCSSGYGGALVHLGGSLTLSNVTFENNSATYKGGAAYISNRELLINNSKFSNNRLGDEELSFGGALYLDFISDEMAVTNTRFIENSNQAIYCYDSIVNVSGCYFEGNGVAIHSVNTQSVELQQNNYTTDKVIANDTDLFRYVIEGAGIKLELVNNTIAVDNLPSRFDSRDWGWVTPPKNQGFSGGCWCFSTISVLETALLKATGIPYDFSEQNIQKLSLVYYKYGHMDLGEGGFTTVAIQYLLSWLGPIPDEYDTFDMMGKITREIPTSQNVHVQDAILVPVRANATDNDAIKWAIIRYGSVTTDFLSDTEAPNFNKNTSAYYYDKVDDTPATHAVAIVGWDDDYPAANFIITPPGNGAWIIKNSYGNESFDDGYVYISYYDTIMSMKGEGIGIVVENIENYTKNYQTDIIGDVRIHTESETYSYRNSYRSIGDDLISAVGTYFDRQGEEYCLEIYINNALKLTQNGSAPFRGFHTIKLAKEIPVREGDNFTAIVKTHSVPILNNSRMHFMANVSFVDDCSGWRDLFLENSTAVLKVYTKDLPDPLTTSITAPAVACLYNGGKYLTVALVDIFGDAISGEYVSVKINGVSKTLKTDENGRAKLSLDNLVPKTYSASVVYAGSDKYAESNATAKVTVKKATPKLTAKAKTFKKSTKTKKYRITLKTNKNRAMKKAKVYIKVNKKTYTAKTNGKGVATFKINKLAKKGKFTATITYKGSSCYNKAVKKVKITVK